jgi:hypothetical protein
MSKKLKKKFKDVGEMLGFLHDIGKRNEAAIKQLDKEIKKYEMLEVKAISVQEVKIKYKASAKRKN